MNEIASALLTLLILISAPFLFGLMLAVLVVEHFVLPPLEPFMPQYMVEKLPVKI